MFHPLQVIDGGVYRAIDDHASRVQGSHRHQLVEQLAHPLFFATGVMKDFFVAGLVELNFPAQLDELTLNVGSSLVIVHQVNPQLINLLDPELPAMALELDGPLYWFNEGNRIISLPATVRRPQYVHR